MSSRTRDISGLTGGQRPSGSVKKGKNYLMVVAIDDYTHLPKLYNCVKDATDITQQLTYKYNFQEEHVFSLYNEQASLDNIYKQLVRMSHAVSEEDNLVIYFSGHGYFDKDSQTGHLIPVGAEQGKVWDYLSNSDFLNRIRAIKSKHTLVILDSCFSGSLFSSKVVPMTYSDRVSNFKSRWGIAAGRVEVVEDGLHGENSPFATAIVNFLKKNESKKFPVSDLIQYVKKVTALNSDQTPIAGPIKNLGDEGGEFVFEQKQDVEVEWKNAETQNTAESYAHFLDVFPDSKYAALATAKLAPLRESLVWKKIMATPHDKLESVTEKQRLLTEYKFNYPHGKYNIKGNELMIHLDKTEALLKKKREHQTSTTTQPTPTQVTDAPASDHKREDTTTIAKTIESSSESNFISSNLFKGLAVLGMLTILSSESNSKSKPKTYCR